MIFQTGLTSLRMSGNGDLWIYLDIRKLRIAQNPILIEVKNIPLRNLHFFLIT